jgi:CDP-diglyceride synthetase
MLEIMLLIFGFIFLIISKFLDFRLLNRINKFDKKFPSTSITSLLIIFYYFRNEDYKFKISFIQIFVIWLFALLGLLMIAMSIYFGINS